MTKFDKGIASKIIMFAKLPFTVSKINLRNYIVVLTVVSNILFARFPTFECIPAISSFLCDVKTS